MGESVLLRLLIDISVLEHDRCYPSMFRVPYMGQLGLVV